MHRLGRRVVSCDPLYRYGADEIRARIDAVYPELVETAARERHRFVWDVIRSPEELGQVRLAAMRDFLDDYEAGRRAGRYVVAGLPELPFPDGSFDLALCSHFLFLYSDELPLDYHQRSVMEMCRVAHEVRIFPLLDLKGEPSGHVGAVLEELRRRGWVARLERVPYEFQKGGNEMMRIVLPRWAGCAGGVQTTVTCHG
jgi:hypothetical protein